MVPPAHRQKQRSQIGNIVYCDYYVLNCAVISLGGSVCMLKVKSQVSNGCRMTNSLTWHAQPYIRPPYLNLCLGTIQLETQILRSVHIYAMHHNVQ